MVSPPAAPPQPPVPSPLGVPPADRCKTSLDRALEVEHRDGRQLPRTFYDLCVGFYVYCDIELKCTGPLRLWSERSQSAVGPGYRPVAVPLPGTRAARPVRDDRRCPRVSLLRYSFPLCFIPEFADGDAPRARAGH